MVALMVAAVVVVLALVLLAVDKLLLALSGLFGVMDVLFHQH
jgi:hypothetical protein